MPLVLTLGQYITHSLNGLYGNVWISGHLSCNAIVSVVVVLVNAPSYLPQNLPVYKYGTCLYLSVVFNPSQLTLSC